MKQSDVKFLVVIGNIWLVGGITANNSIIGCICMLVALVCFFTGMPKWWKGE